MTASLPTLTSLMDQARSAVAELDQAIADIDETVHRLRGEIDQAQQRRRELVDQRRPIAAIIPGRAQTASTAAPAAAQCTNCAKPYRYTKSLREHEAACPKRPAPADPADTPPPAAEVAPPVTPSPGAAAGPLDADIAALFEKHNRESFSRRCELAADALGKTPSQIRGVAQRLGLA